jgi:integrase
VLRASIRDWLAGPKNEEPPLYLRRWSLPLSEINEDVCKVAAQAVYRKQDGSAVAASSQHRIRTNVRAMFKAAVAAKKMTAQPWPGATARKTERITKQVNVRALPNQREALKLIAQQKGDNFKVLGYMCFYAGLRPSEAVAVTVERCTLPETGWGIIRIDQAVQDAGRWTEAGEEIGDPKTHARTVPIPPQLVEILRAHIGDRTSGLVVSTRNGTPVLASNWGDAWRAARAALGVTWVPYDLRHACATTWLGAGVPIGECARRLGHSPEVLLSTYAGVLTGDEQIANARIEKALAG